MRVFAPMLKKKDNIFLLFQLIGLSLCINFTHRVRAIMDWVVNYKFKGEFAEGVIELMRGYYEA